uniref:BRCT domain-containing protein n=1 Tax=Meloidogyne incognita TaxID=6306 RepID=A0A914M8G1_MELIC
MSSELDVTQPNLNASINNEHNETNGEEQPHLDSSQDEANQQDNNEVNGQHIDEEHGNDEADNDGVEEEKDLQPPFTPPANVSSGIVTSANRRTSTRKRRMAVPALTPTSSVKRRRITNDGRGNTPVSTPNSVKKRRTRVKDQSEMPLIDLDDSNDPYNFTANSDSHPEPLADICVKRASFGEIKFTKSLPGSSERYANVERIAAERNPSLLNNTGMGASFRSASKSSDSFRLELSMSNSRSPKSAATTASRITANSGHRKNVNYAADDDNDSIDNFKMDEEEEQMITPNRRGRKSAVASPKTPKNTPKAALTSELFNTPEIGKKKPQTAVSASAKKAALEAEFYIVPELTPKEQYDVDHPEDIGHFLSPGARVLALWGNEYYGAHICGREALGRYYVLFAEDNLKRILPPSGVLAISFLSEGFQVSFIDSIANEEVGKVAIVEKQPQIGDKQEPNEWVNGMFTLRELDDEMNSTQEIREILWSRIFLTKDQAAIILKGRQFNPVPKIDQENIISESRSTRRSRSSRLCYSDFGSASPSPMKTPTSIKRSEASLIATPKTPQHKSPKGRGSTTPRSNRKKINLAGSPEDNKPDTTDMPVLSAYGKEEQDDEQVEGNNEDIKSDDIEDKNLTNKSSPRITRSRASNSNVTTPVKQQTPRKSPRSAKKNETKEEEVDDYLETTDEKIEVTINEEDLDSFNDSHNSTIIEDSTPQRKPSPFDAVQILSPVQEITELNTTGSYSSSAGSVGEAQLFVGFKFVLTSANRPNKVSDFNKRDYRTKIEERGGIVMEDFSTLQEGEHAFLIADTFYRTHKYLCALSLSIPCLSYLWIQECVSKKKLVEYEEFLLPAGESTSEPGRICQWKPLKGVLFNGKRVIIYNRHYNQDPNVIPFGEIWIALMRNLGATVVGIGHGEPFSKEANLTASLEEKLEFCRKTDFDIFLTENDCEPQLARCATAKNALAVSSEWIIQAMVTGELPPIEECDRFRYDYT